MRRYIGLVVIAVVAMVLWGCNSQLEKNARDAAAGLKGAIQSAQQQYGEGCKADPSKSQCRTINKGVDGQNLLIDAIDTYCGWAAHTPPENPGAACTPVKSAEPALQAAIQNAQSMITEVKGIVK